MVVNKPQGMVVHPSGSYQVGPLVNALLYHVKGPFRDQWGIASRDRSSDRQRHLRPPDGRKNDQAHVALAEELKDKNHYGSIGPLFMATSERSGND